jgi:hypothetical protein
MKIEEFRQLDAAHRIANGKLFELATPDQPVSMDQIENVEREVGVKFPESYKHFLHEFGGGAYGLLTVYSADPNGDWYLPSKLSEMYTQPPEMLLPIIDDFSGGYYALRVIDGVALEPIYYWNVDDGIVPTEYQTALDFIARYAYEAA